MRTRQWEGHASRAVAFLALTLATSPAGAQANVPPRNDADGNTYAYYYFKARHPVELDRTRVAILSAAAGEGAPALAPGLSQYGLDVSAAEPQAVRGWWFAGTTAAVRTDTGIERAVRELAEGAAVDFASPVFLDENREPIFITPEILVGFDRSLDRSRVEAVLAASRAGTIVDRDWANMKLVYRLRSPSRDGFEVLRAANDLAQRPEVTFAQPDMMAIGHLAWIPNDPYFPYLWGLHNKGNFPPTGCVMPDFDMDAPEAWDITTGDPSILVAVLDTGVQLDHPDLNLRLPGFDATGQGGGGGPVNACDNHGTPVAGFVSGIIDNDLGIVGAAPGVKTASARMIVSSLACDSTGTIASSWVVAALAWAEEIGARITNSSWYRNVPDPAITQMFLDTRDRGMLHFAAAGNNASSTIVYPASLPSVNAVAALEPCGGRAPFSNYGNGLAFSAAGYGVSSDRTGGAGYNDGIGDGVCFPSGTVSCGSDVDCPSGNSCFLVSVDYALFVGTSMASPYAAGVAALALSVNPSLTLDQLETVLRVSAVDLGTAGYDTDFGWGFVNAFNAVQLALSTPGEAADLRVTSRDPITGDLGLSYVPGCGSLSHDIYHGPLSQVSSYVWSGSTCDVGDSGQVAGFNPGPGSSFFVVVANASVVEGSYGTGDPGTQRPAAGSQYCDRTQLPGPACP